MNIQNRFKIPLPQSGYWLAIIVSFFCALVLFSGGLSAAEKEGGAGGDTFMRAEQLFRSGNYLEAQALYQEFFNQHPADKRMDQIFFRLGQIDVRNHSYKSALRYFQFVLSKFPDTFLLPQVKFETAECYLNLENYREAEELFQAASKGDPDGKKRWEAVLYLGVIDENRLDYENAIAKYKRVYSDSNIDDLKARALQATEKVVNDKLPKATIVSLIQAYKSEFPADLLLLRAMALSRLESDQESYQNYLNEFLQRFPKHTLRPDLEKKQVLSKVNKPKVFRLGAILPLTGKNALIGQQVLQGIQLAWNQLSVAEREKFELVVKNSGESQTISPLAEELGNDPDMVGILGPLFSENVKEVIPIIEKYQMPIFTSTASTQGLTQLSSYVFRNAMTKENQGKFLAEYAFNHLGLRRFAILYPDEPYGVELKDIFSREFQALGGEIVVTVSYDRNQNDFKEQILRIGGVSDHTLRKYADNKFIPNEEKNAFSKPVIERGTSPDGKDDTLKIYLDLSYDAIFIPGYYDKVGLILPELAFYNLGRVPVLGGNAWNSPDLPRVAGKYLKKAIFVDGFFPNSREKEVREFVSNFKSTFGDDPTLFSAQSYDAARIFIDLLRKGASNRVQIKAQLHTIRDFPGASGKTTILSTGDTEKSLFPLKVKGDKIVPASEPE